MLIDFFFFLKLVSLSSHTFASIYLCQPKGGFMPRSEVAFVIVFVPGSNLLGTLEGVVVARNVRHDCTLIRFWGVDQICFTFERLMFSDIYFAVVVVRKIRKKKKTFLPNIAFRNVFVDILISQYQKNSYLQR